jgi:hypothetical protein
LGIAVTAAGSSEKVFLQYIIVDKLEFTKKHHNHNMEWKAKKYESMYVIA